MVLRDVNETSEIGQIGDKNSAKQHNQIVNMSIPFFRWNLQLWSHGSPGEVNRGIG